MRGGSQEKNGGEDERQHVYIISKLKSDMKAGIHSGGKRRDKIWETMERNTRKRYSKQYQEYYLIALQE